MSPVNYIEHVTDWFPLSDIGSSSSNRMEEYWNLLYAGEHVGVYQVSLEQPKDLVHPEIGYIGKSKILPTRLYELNLNTRSPISDAHNCGRYLRETGIDINQIFVRIIFTDPKMYGDVEMDLQKQMTDRFNYPMGFKWTKATAGQDSAFYKAKNCIRSLSIDDMYKLKMLFDEEIINRTVENVLKNLPRTLDRF